MSDCIAPPGPDDWALIAYIDGDGDPATIDHLRHCSHCRLRAAEVAQRQLQVSALLFRIDCLSMDELQDYHFGFLTAAESNAATAHMQRCPHCTRELATMARFLLDDADELGEANVTQEKISSSSILERIETVIARWLQGGRNTLSPALAGLRGADNSQVLYSAGEMQIGIDIQADYQQPNRREIVGSIMGVELSDLSGVAWRVHLWQADQLVAVAALDELGSFVFANLAPTDYELIITGPGIAIDVASISIT